jgi:hypothetical protein
MRMYPVSDIVNRARFRFFDEHRRPSRPL